MSDQPIEAAPEQDSPAEPDYADPPAEATDGQPAADSPNAEAAKYRRRLREAETKLAVSDARAEMLLRREIERLAGDRLADGAEVWRDNTQLDALIGEDGLPSADAVAARVSALLEAHPHWQRVNLKRLTPPASSVSGNVVPISDGPAASWGEVLGRRG